MGSDRDRALLPWVEKYRPKILDDVQHQEDVVKSLKRSLETHDLPHLLFYGPPGTGKTSTILAAANELYGPILLKSRVKELNASDERGIDIVRSKIKEFAQVAVGNDKTPGYPCPPYKIIILDECDSMTQDAQSALRRVMENFSKVTRFCLICNYVTRIIDPIASRCAKFRFKPLDPCSITRRICQICESERITIAEDALQTLPNVSYGDMRTAINLLQSAQLLHETDDPITSETIVEIAGVIPDAVVSSLLEATKRSVGILAIDAAVRDVIASGYPAGKVLEQFQGAIENDSDLTDASKSQICLKIGDMDQALAEGADEYLQLLSLLSYTSKIRMNQGMNRGFL